MINYIKKIIMKNKKSKSNEILLNKVNDYIEDNQDKILQNQDNYVNNLFAVLNETAHYEGEEEEKNYSVLIAFVMQKTVPLFFKDYEGSEYENKGYKEAHALLNEKFKEMIIRSNEHAFRVWKEINEEGPWEDYPTAFVILSNIFDEAEAQREKNILNTKIQDKLIKNTNRQRM